MSENRDRGLATQGEYNRDPQELQKLEAQLAEARVLLKELEWSGSNRAWKNGCCHYCAHEGPELNPIGGHAPDCRLEKFLEGE